MAERALQEGRGRAAAPAPSGCRPLRHVAPRKPHKLEVVEALTLLAEEAGLSLIHLAIAFVLRHPAVTAAIIGPRTMEQLESQLGAAEVVLDHAVLDRIDEIVPPGTNSTRPTPATPRRRSPNPLSAGGSG